MKLNSLIVAAILGSTASLFAGPMSSGKDSKVSVPGPIPEAGCEAFNGGWAASVFGLMLTPDSDYDEGFGGGLGAEYFFNPYVGIAGVAQWAEHEDTQAHNYAADLVVRYPITSICVAPYAFAGAGVHCNSVTEFIGRVGAGLDVRLFQNHGIFADWTYTLPGGGGGSDDLEDYQLVRVGLKFAF